MSNSSASIVINASDLFLLLSCTMEYSMGRMTCIVSDCDRMIREHWLEMNSAGRSILFHSLRERLLHANSRKAFLGMSVDHDVWANLLKFMENNM
jgi:hypothetical protein